jgi:hypothetical protein
VGKFDLYVGRSVLLATLGVLLLLVGLDSLTSIVDETNDMRDGYSFLDILIYVGYTLPRRVHEFVPFAALIGALIGLGRLACFKRIGGDTRRGRVDVLHGDNGVKACIAHGGGRFCGRGVCCTP